jgi:hypothetical protein
MANSVVIWLSAKLFYFFAKFEMAPSTTSIKEFSVLKQCWTECRKGSYYSEGTDNQR